MTLDRHDSSAEIRDDELPPFSRLLYGWFKWHVRKYLTRNFHAARLLSMIARPTALPQALNG